MRAMNYESIQSESGYYIDYPPKSGLYIANPWNPHRTPPLEITLGEFIPNGEEFSQRQLDLKFSRQICNLNHAPIMDIKVTKKWGVE